MRKGFSATLATVAFAMLGVHAMALAPTISEIPDIIVGDAEDTSAANIFVFPDALNLNTSVSDDETSDGGIIWSYWIAGAGGVYSINNTDPVPDPNDASNIVNPPTAQRIDANTDPADGDADPRTITIRDIQRSPIGGEPYADPAGGPGILPDSRVITLFASDGSTTSLDNAQSFIVYTDDDGFDRFSGGTPPDYSEDNPGINWQWAEEIEGAGNATVSQPNGNACFSVVAGEGKVNLYRYYSDYGAVQLTPNTVYEARIQVTTNQTTFNETPFWSWLWDNVSHDGLQGQNEYTGEYFMLDNEGGANSPISGIGRNDFAFWMFPVQGRTAQFNDATNGFFRAGNSANKDMRLVFRLFDYSDGGFGSQFDNGSVCLESVEIFSHSLAAMQVQSTVYDVSNLVGESPLTAESWGVQVFGEPTDTTFSGGNLTVSPQTSWTNDTVINITPGDSDQGPITDGPAIADNWPIPWVSDELYYIEFMMSAPSATDEQNPPDVISVGADTPTAELTMMHSLIPNTKDESVADPASLRGVSAPRAGAPQPYVAFFNTHSKTLSGEGDDVAIWRPRLQVLNATALEPWGRTDNTGGFTVHSVKVQRVTF